MMADQAQLDGIEANRLAATFPFAKSKRRKPAPKDETMLCMKSGNFYRAFFAAWFLVLASGPVGAQSGTNSIKPSSGEALCSALTPADFNKAGVPVSKLYPPHPDSSEGAYCVYESKAGKVEFDIFFPAGANSVEVSNTERAAVQDAGGKYERVRLDGADNAQISLTADAIIVVRKGKAVFDIGIPKTSNSRQQLLALAQVVLVRLKQ